MPIGINSPAKNLFLLGSSGAQVVTNFFKQIDQTSSGDFFHTPSEIRYVESDEKYILAGEADRSSPASEKYGWIEKRQEDGTQDWETQVSSTTGDNTSLQALELDGSNLVAVGKTGGVPWIAKYTDGGVITWQSTTNSGDVEYTGVAVDSNGNYYACGSTPDSASSTSPATAFVEKFDSSGNPGWGKSAFMVGRDIKLNKISANSRGEVVAVGYLEDDSADKGYIIKIDTTTGDVLWDRTLELNVPAANIELTGIYVDNKDEIYVCGNIKYDVVGQTIAPVDGFIAKYTAEGNLLWQSQSDYASGTSAAVRYQDITVDNTTKKPTTFGYVRYAVGDSGTLISRYDPDGTLSWRREIDEGNSFDPRRSSIDGDQSFIYLLFADTADSETYVYGKVSATGNGLGDFEYDDGTGAPLLQYITSSGPNGSDIGEKIGRLSDGSVRNDTSDLITYPFTANKLLFDDLATQVSNKKRQMDTADSFEYSGSPAIRPADFSDVNVVAGETTIPAQNRQNMIGQTQLMTPSGAYVNDNDDYTRRWRAQSANVVYDYGFAGPYDDPAATTAGRYAITAATGRRLEYAGPVVVAGQKYTFSMWLKRIASDAQFRFQAYNLNSYDYVMNEVDFYGNVIKTISTGSTTYFPEDDGWHRISISFTSDLNATIAIGGFDGSGSTGNRWYLYGAQFVDGVEALPYHAITDSANGGIDPRIDTLKDTTPPVTNGYFDFTGNDSAQDMIEMPPVDYRDAIWSADAWIYIPSTWTSGSQYPNIISQGASAGWDTPGWSLYCFRNYGSGTGYTIGVGMRNRSGTLGVNGVEIQTLNAADQPTDTWIHACATCDGTTRRLYINGTEVNSGAQTISFFDQNELDGKPLETVKIGAAFNINGGFRSFFPGRIGEARSYGKALTATQVFQNYNATKSKYISEAPDTAPKITSDGIVIDSNLVLNYDFGNRATYDDTQNYLLDNFASDTDTGEYLTDGVGKHKIYQADTDINSAYGSSQMFSPGTYDVSVSMWMKADDIQTNQFALKDSLGTPVGGTYSFTPNVLYPDGAIFSYTWNNVTISDSWNFGVYNNNGDARTMLYARPQLTLKSSTGRYVKTYGSVITAPTTVKNLSSSSIPGTINGATFNSAGYFDFGTTSQQNIISTTGTNCSTLLGTTDSGGSCTIECWVNLDDTFTKQTILSGFNGSDNARWDLEVDTGNLVFIRHTNGSTTATGGISAFAWSHVVVTRGDGSDARIRIYLNGSEVGTSLLGGQLGSGVPLGLGMRPDGSTNYPLDGKIAEVRTYTRFLSSTEVSQNYNATRAKYGV